MEYPILTIRDYPDNGKHQECKTGLPFQIRKGEDGYYWTDKKGKEHKYNIYADDNKVDERWIVHLVEDLANESLKQIFEVKVNKDLNKIIDYCRKTYKKSLQMEIKRLKVELKKY